MMPNFIEGNQPHEPHDLSQVVENDEVGSMRINQIILNDEERMLPSMLLSNESWVEYAADLLGLDMINSSPTEVTLFDKEKAHTLLRKLEG